MQTSDRRLLHADWSQEARPIRPISPGVVADAAGIDGRFERIARLYGFFREHVFRDDTEHIAQSLRATGWSPVGTTLLEIGCGPGLYARRLAARYAGLRTVGLDRSRTLVALARERAASEGLRNCRFEQGDALALDWPDQSVDAVVTSRLLTVVDAPGVIGEIHRVLRPGGRYFLAEPAPVVQTAAAFAVLRAARWLADLCAAENPSTVAGPSSRRLPIDEITSAIESRPWSRLDVTYEYGYHYVVCQKPPEWAT